MSYLRNNKLELYLHQDLRGRERSSSITTNYYHYDSLYDALEINVDNTRRGYIALPTGFVKAGTSIKFNFEAMNLTGSNIRFALDLLNNNDTTNIANVDTSSTDNMGNFKNYSYNFVVKNDGFHWVTLGYFLNDIGSGYIRNVSIDYKGEFERNPYFPRQRPKDIKIGLMEWNGSNFERLPTFSDDFFTVSRDPNDSNIFIVTYSSPFENIFYRPVVLADNDYYQGGDIYTIITSSSQIGSFRFRVRNNTTGNYVNTFQSGITFKFIAIGLKYD